MAIVSTLRAGLGAVALIAFVPFTASHSWIEEARKIAANGTFVGEPGYARGWFARTDPGWSDVPHVQRLPYDGSAFYTADMNINKYEYTDKPKMPMLEAAPGDFIALLHTENGHTTLPENNPAKPLNRGTIYIYGTKEPKAEEKLLDVHLAWNRDGTGGDGRGRLLATRNYDDGKCFQAGAQEMVQERVQEFKDMGADPNKELKCQTDLQLPEDLEADSIYTLYWYWDWPDLNPDAIDQEATKNGQFPWAGTFMRGETDPNGFTMDAIAKNESYSSVIDIKITGEATGALSAKGDVNSFMGTQDIYNMAVESQLLDGNFAVDVDGNEGSNGGSPAPSESSPPTEPTATLIPSEVPGVPSPTDGGVVTATVTETLPPPTSTVMVTVTVPAEQPGNGQETSSCNGAPSSTATVITTLYTTLQPETTNTPSTTATVIETRYSTLQPESSGAPLSTATIIETRYSTLPPDPVVTETPPAQLRARRTDWGFGF